MNQTYQLENWGPFEVIEIPHPNPKQTLVVLHGYGADAFDLAPLSQVFLQGEPTRWIFIQAPHAIEIAPGAFGRAWFEIPLSAMQNMMSGQPLAFDSLDPPGMKEVAHSLAQWLKELWSAKQIQENTFLGGFSQGAMVSLEVALQLKENLPAGVFQFSGALCRKTAWSQWVTENPQVKQIPIFQSHGKSDPVLSFGGAQSLHAFLEAQGFHSEFHPFEGGHEIPISIVPVLNQFIVKG